jgi:hypothetical protein
LTAAQLLSEGVATQQQPSSFAAGFDWAAEQLRQAGFEQLAAEVSARACAYGVVKTHVVSSTWTGLHNRDCALAQTVLSLA